MLRKDFIYSFSQNDEWKKREEEENHKIQRKVNRKKSKTRPNKKRRNHHYSSSDDSDTSSMLSSSTSNSESNEYEQKNKIEGFHVIAHEDINKYDLPEDRACYVNKHISNLIPEKESKDSTLVITPVPNNIDKVHQIDNFIKQVL